MTYAAVMCGRTEFAVDWDVVERLCRSYWQTSYQYRNSRTVTLSESSWYNPFSWKLPDVKTIDVDWDGVRRDVASAVTADMFNYQQRAAWAMPDIARELEWRLGETARLRRYFIEDLKGVQTANLQAMSAAESDYTGLIEASRFIRDTSADIVAIGSTIATGGAATGLLGASSALKGYGKYQDTGSVGASVLYGAGSMLLGAFKVGGAKLSAAGEYTLIVAQGSLEAGTSFAAGDSFGKALATGGLKIASAGAAQAIFGSDVAKKAFERLPVPMNVWVKCLDEPGHVQFVDKANDLLAKTVKKAAEKTVKFGASQAVTAFSSAVKQASPPAPRAALVDDVPVEQRLLLYLAVVNMEKGIGRGW